jgi:hypothetical protein
VNSASSSLRLSNCFLTSLLCHLLRLYADHIKLIHKVTHSINMSTEQAVYNKSDNLYTYPQDNLPTAMMVSNIEENSFRWIPLGGFWLFFSMVFTNMANKCMLT